MGKQVLKTMTHLQNLDLCRFRRVCLNDQILFSLQPWCKIRSHICLFHDYSTLRHGTIFLTRSPFDKKYNVQRQPPLLASKSMPGFRLLPATERIICHVRLSSNDCAGYYLPHCFQVWRRLCISLIRPPRGFLPVIRVDLMYACGVCM